MDQIESFAQPFMTDDPVTVATEDGGTFTVPRALLQEVYPYLQDAPVANHAEHPKKVLSIAGPARCTTSVFKVLLYWLAHRSLPDFRELDEHGMNHGAETIIATTIDLIQLWAIGDAIGMPKLQNVSMKRIGNLEDIPREITLEIVKSAFAASPPDSALRRFYTAQMLFFKFSNTLDSADMEILAQIPGFLGEFADKVAQLYDGDEDGFRQEMKEGTWSETVERYLVTE